MGTDKKLSTLCYMEKDGKYLMLHRTVKKNDVNKDKWIGVGGHFEEDESPEECLLREVREETGYTLTSWRFRGIVTFVSGDGVTEYMHLFTADGFEGEPAACDEGQLEWVDIEKVWSLNIWEGDKIFFRLIDEDAPFFSLKLVYNGQGGLVSAALDGRPMELFDILNEDGSRSGLVRERGVAHRDGSLHETVHTWIVRRKQEAELQEELFPEVLLSGKNIPDERIPDERIPDERIPDGRIPDERIAGDKSSEKAGAVPAEAGGTCCKPVSGWEILLQKRSAVKDSNPGCYDISSAGHLSAGDQPLEGALRELKEELGITASPGDLHFVGKHKGAFQAVFHGYPFRDSELSNVYVVTRHIDDKEFHLQAEEVESVRWMDFEACRRAVLDGSLPNCIYRDELDMVGDYLASLS